MKKDACQKYSLENMASCGLLKKNVGRKRNTKMYLVNSAGLEKHCASNE